MSIEPTKSIWKDGKLVDWDSATVHVLGHVLHYGTSVFEGIRCYQTPDGPKIFRLAAHTRRLFDSAKIYRMPIPYSPEQINKACCETIIDNELTSAYIRPLVYRGFGSLSILPDECPIEVVIAAIKWGAFLGDEAIKNGIDVCVSSWQRMTSASTPLLSKAGGHYLNSQLIAGDAKRGGFGEAVAVNADGTISEGSAENVFIVRDETVYTTPAAASILCGITRDSVLCIASHLNFEVREQAIPRDFLYLADEIFLTGTAAEITPVKSVDGVLVGNGIPGPVTGAIQSEFFGLFNGKTEDRWGWLDCVHRL